MADFVLMESAPAGHAVNYNPSWNNCHVALEHHDAVVSVPTASAIQG